MHIDSKKNSKLSIDAAGIREGIFYKEILSGIFRIARKIVLH